MTQKLTILFSIILLLFSSIGKAQNGQEIFTGKCTPCHTIGNGRLVGPDLKGVHKKYNSKYLAKWIKSSQSVINSGDAKAKALFEEYNSIIMPDFSDLTDNDIKALIEYIKIQSGDAEVQANEDPKSNTTAVVETKSNENITPSTDFAVSKQSESTAEKGNISNTNNLSSTVTTTPIQETTQTQIPYLWLMVMVGVLMVFVIIVLIQIIFTLIKLKKA